MTRRHRSVCRLLGFLRASARKKERWLYGMEPWTGVGVHYSSVDARGQEHRRDWVPRPRFDPV